LGDLILLSGYPVLLSGYPVLLVANLIPEDEDAYKNRYCEPADYPTDVVE